VKIPIDSIIVDPSIQIRQRLHEEAVTRYVDAFDELPPIVVFETAEGRLLSDGMHRLAAANRLGMLDIEVELRNGTRADAEEHAITANTKNAIPLTASELEDGIGRLKARGDGWRVISKKMSLPEKTVNRILQGQAVARSLGNVTLPSRSHYEELARLPQ
jgi:ParB-like chromosome segregation protein Spo0J